MVLTSSDDISAVLASDDYSQVFKVVLKERDVSDLPTAKDVNDRLIAVLESLQSTLTIWSQTKSAETEARIKAFKLEQRKALESQLAKGQQERERLYSRIREAQGKAAEGSGLVIPLKDIMASAGFSRESMERSASSASSWSSISTEPRQQSDITSSQPVPLSGQSQSAAAPVASVLPSVAAATEGMDGSKKVHFAPVRTAAAAPQKIVAGTDDDQDDDNEDIFDLDDGEDNGGSKAESKKYLSDHTDEVEEVEAEPETPAPSALLSSSIPISIPPKFALSESLNKKSFLRKASVETGLEPSQVLLLLISLWQEVSKQKH
ncbi:hypothetical protein HDU76_011260 [Blyttiomyces sp. JEL0837]|nr:hypothetical protein HDU76_011260 [Blyttiomyces sp. JEL0837]